MHATSKGHGTVVKVLLEFGARTESVNKNGWTPLQIASSNGDFTSSNHLIGAHALIESSDPNDRRTPLHRSAQAGHSSLALLLLENGADPNTPDIFGKRPLHLASVGAYDEVVKILIENGAICDLKDSFRKKPVDYASRSRAVLSIFANSSEIVARAAKQKALVEVARGGMIWECEIERGSFVPYDARWSQSIAQALKGPTSIISGLKARGQVYTLDLGRRVQINEASLVERRIRPALWLNLLVAATRGEAAIVEDLIRKTVDAVQHDDAGRSALSHASEQGHEDIVQLILDHIYNKPLQFSLAMSGDKKGKTPLMYCCERGLDGVAAMLIDFRADVNAADAKGFTALHYAARTNQVETIRLLLSAGALPSAKDKTGKPPALLAEKGAAAVFVLQRAQSLEYSQGWEPIHWASAQGDLSRVRTLLRHNPRLLVAKTRSNETLRCFSVTRAASWPRAAL